MARFWGTQRYYSLNWYLKTHYEKMYRLALGITGTCPNRDGHVGRGGCIFCSEQGSGDFAGQAVTPVPVQLAEQKRRIAKKYSGSSYIAYFQAFTSTYGNPQYLREHFMAAAADPEVKIISIATRPDCLGPEVMDILKELNRIKPVWVELGLQTIHERTADFINRCYPLSVYDQAVYTLRSAGIEVITHIILCLPGETAQDMLETVEYLNRQDIQGIKISLLYVLKHTKLADYYKKEPFYLPDRDEYCQLLGMVISHLRDDIVIHRFTGDAPRKLLIEPQWTVRKWEFLNRWHEYLEEQDLWQGKEYKTDE